MKLAGKIRRLLTCVALLGSVGVPSASHASPLVAPSVQDQARPRPAALDLAPTSNAGLVPRYSDARLGGFAPPPLPQALAPALPSSRVTLPDSIGNPPDPITLPLQAVEPPLPSSKFPIPEPASLVLLTTGLLGLILRRELQRRKIA